MMFILRETLRFLRHHFGAWLMACITFAVALGVSGLFAMLAWKAHSAMAELRANLTIEAFFDPGLSSEEAEAITHEKIDSLPGLARTEFISKEQALVDYTKSSGEDVETVLGMNPLPASVTVYLRSPDARSAEAVESALRAVRGIQSVRGNFPMLRTMESRSRSLDAIAVLLCSLLLVSAFFYAAVAGRHSFEISGETLRTFDLLGATRLVAIIPVVLTSALAGLIGGLLGWWLIWLVRTQVGHSSDLQVAFSVTRHEALLWLVMLAIIGMLIGTLGAAISGVRRSFAK